VNAAFADAALRLDCRDHEDAGAAEAARNWQIFAAPSAPQEARRHNGRNLARRPVLA
jgi:hypothetical protein